MKAYLNNTQLVVPRSMSIVKVKVKVKVKY